MRGRAVRIAALSALLATGIARASPRAATDETEKEPPLSPLAQATARGAAAFREVCLLNIGRRDAMQAAAKAARFVPMPQSQTGVVVAGDAWASGNDGYPLVLLISRSGQECVTILRKADRGSVLALGVVLPLAYRKPPNAGVRVTREADQPDREVVAFRVKSLPATPGLADRLVILEPDFRPEAPANLVLTARLVAGE